MGHTIGKVFTFSASHQLHGLPDGHKCARLHGHNYKIEVVFEAQQLVAPGFVTDFGDLAPLKGYIDACLDHRHLNDILDEAPTSENLATHLGTWVIEHLEPNVPGRLLRLRVSETASSWAEFTPDRNS